MSDIREIIGNTTTTPVAQADWEETSKTKASYIKNKPTVFTEEEIKAFATDVAVEQVQVDWEQLDDSKVDFIKNKPTVLTEDNVKALIDEFGGDTQIQADWEQDDDTAQDYIKNKPELVSIESVAKTSSENNVDTYTFNFTNGTSFAFSVTNGVDGKDGVAGITHTWDGSVLTITSASGTSSVDLRGPQGDKGEIGGADGLITCQDENGNNLLYLTYEGTIIGDGVIIPQGGGGGGGTGGGGGNTNNAVLTVKNTTGWLAKTISSEADCYVSLTWQSVEDDISTGNGRLKIIINGATKTMYEVEQGDLSINVSQYLRAGLNEVKLEVLDVYGNSRFIIYSINCVAISISSYFDDTIAYSGAILFQYTPVGSVTKTVHFLIDGEEESTAIVQVSNRPQDYTIPAQSHGHHTFEVYFTCEIEGYPAESNHLFYDLICYEDGKLDPIISIDFRELLVTQYSTVVIPYIVYTPGGILTSSVDLKDNGQTVQTLTVDRTQQIWSYKALSSGTANLSIVCGDTVRDISFEVTANNIKVDAETTGLELYLSSVGRDNKEDNPLAWSYGTVNAELTNFNLVSDGWKLDDNKNTVLRVSGDARVYIPFNIFAQDFRTAGKTIELEFATRDVLNYDAVILSSWSGERGIKITAQKALMKSEQSEIFTQYKENETVRIAFTVEKRAENRLLAIYINGIMSGVLQYPDDDDFTQPDPVGITIGSNDCTTDIYCIRVYNNNLTRYQLIDNWIADTQNVGTMADRYNRNNIFDDYGNITIAKLPSYLPYMILNTDSYSKLPQSKGDKKTISGSYVDPLYPGRSFTFTGAEIDVQGTSSQYYSRKNYKIKFNGGFESEGTVNATYQLRPTSMPTDVFTFKADVASSEGANNVELVKLYDDTCPVKTPPQQADSRVRQGIEGYPMLMFYGDGTTLTFLGKYNFNNDKGTEEVFGFSEGDESWEILQNNTEMVIWKDDNFAGDGWKTSFEARYPEDNTNLTNLQAFATWLKSTDTTAVDTEEEKKARIAKFRSEFANYANVDAMIFNYIFTETFLMVDNRAKNAFPTRYDADGKWLILPYDMDTAIGINNEGELKFGYELEDTDLINGNNVFNGQDSVLYVNMRLAFADEIMQMYQDLRRGDIFSYDEIESRFEEHQSVWGEAIFNEDARFKYIEPLINEGNNTYLPMLQGSKAEQRKWWLYNRFRYLDSKYNAGDALEDYIMFRSYAVHDIEVTPYADIYATAHFDSEFVRERALRKDGPQILKNPLSGGRDAVISIYSASQLLSVGDLSGLKLGWADFSKAVKLSSLKVGDQAEDYNNPNLTSLTIGNLVLLRTLDVRNCSNLTQEVDVSGCTNIEHVYCNGTATTGVKLPNGGNLKTLYLPNTVTNLTICNQKQLTDFDLPSYSQISTLRLENINKEIINSQEIINVIQAQSRVRLIGVDWSFDSVDDAMSMMDKLDTFRGLDDYGNNLDKAVVSGKIHVPAVTREDLATMKARYPSITVEYDTLVVNVKFYNGDVLVDEQNLVAGTAITIPEVPTQESTAQFDYSFAGWSLDGVNIVEIGAAADDNTVYYAVYYAILRYYTIRFLNGSTVLQSETFAYGTIPVYSGALPLDPSGNDGEFLGWEPNVAMVTGDADYVALFGLNYILNDDGVSYSVGHVSEKITTAVIVSTYKGLPVTTISNGAFYGCKNLTSVTIPDSVTTIGYQAFYKCTSLSSVVIPDSVTSIGDWAFWGCTSLISVVIGDSVTSIGEVAFSTCTGLSSVVIGDSVTTIGDGAFSGCTSLTSITIPDSVTSFGERMFQDCNSLESATIGSGVTTIHQETFRGCSSLQSLTLPFVGGSASATGASQSTLFGYIFGGFRFDGTVSVDQYCGLSGSVKSYIPAKLKTVTITGGNIFYGAFSNCTMLTSITIGDSVTTIGERAFEDCSSLTSVVIGDSVTSIGNTAFYNCTGLTSIVIPDSVTSISGRAFEGCTGLTSITVNANNPNYKSSDGNLYTKDGKTLIRYALGKTDKTFTVPDSVTSIGATAFSGCTSLSSVVIGDSVTTIGEYAFRGCSSITSIVIPDSVTSIEWYAFYGCTALSDVYYTGSEEEWDKIQMGSSNSSLTNATMHYDYTN